MEFVRVQSKHLNKEGEYSAQVTLEDGYCHQAGTNCTCLISDPVLLRFSVVCGTGSRADAKGDCIEEVSLDHFCDHANVSLGSKVLSGVNAKIGKIGETENLNLAVDRPGLRGMEVVLLPNDTIRGPIDTDGHFQVDVTKTGAFSIDIRDKNSSSACTLQSILYLECKDGHEQVGTVCVLKPEDTKAGLQIVLGISLGVVLALCVLGFLALIRTNPQRAKKLFVSFMRTHP